MAKKEKFLSELDKAEKKAQERQLNKRKNHPCHGCIWGKWDGDIVFCFPGCMKEVTKK